MSPRPLPVSGGCSSHRLRAPPKPAALRYTALRRTAYTPRTPEQPWLAPEEAPPDRRPQRPRRPPQKKRRASPAAPAAGTAEDPIKADSSSEYDSSSDGEGVETRPCRPAERPKKRAAATGERPRKKKTRTGGGTAIYGWHELNADITRTRGVLNMWTRLPPCASPPHATYELDT